MHTHCTATENTAISVEVRWDLRARAMDPCFIRPLVGRALNTFADLAHHEWLRDRMVIAKCGPINNAVDFKINRNQ